MSRPVKQAHSVDRPNLGTILPSQNERQNSQHGASIRRRVLAGLSEAEIRRHQPRQRPFELRDGRGLYLLVNPSGKRWWRFDYTLHGKRNIISLGIYPDVSLAKAREKLHAVRQQVADGLDPSELRKQARQDQATARAATFRHVANEWLKKHPLAPKTHKKLRFLFDYYVFPALGATPISAVTPMAVLAMLTPIEQAGRLETAHRTKQIVGQVCRYAVATGRAATDPTSGLTRALAPVRPTHYAAVTTPKDIGRLLRAIDGYQGIASVRQALRLAPYLFVRPGELRHMEWDEIDWKGELWRIPARKMKMRQDHLVPLSKPALAILTELQPWTGTQRWVFLGLRNSRPISDNALNAALRSLGFDKHTMTSHGFRSMASTRLHEMGIRSDLVELQLSHRERNPSKAAYMRAQFLTERVKLMNDWARELDRLRRS